jgi:DNA-directed RNA polymerase subunit RPC12/RpoP
VISSLWRPFISGALIPVIIVVAGLGINILVQQNLTRRYDYRCDHCGSTFALTTATAAVAPHKMGGAKYVRCPNCGNRSWVTPVPKG